MALPTSCSCCFCINICSQQLPIWMLIETDLIALIWMWISLSWLIHQVSLLVCLSSGLGTHLQNDTCIIKHVLFPVWWNSSVHHALPFLKMWQTRQEWSWDHSKWFANYTNPKILVGFFSKHCITARLFSKWRFIKKTQVSICPRLKIISILCFNKCEN